MKYDQVAAVILHETFLEECELGNALLIERKILWKFSINATTKSTLITYETKQTSSSFSDIPLSTRERHAAEWYHI